MAAAVISIWYVAPEMTVRDKSSYSANRSELCEVSEAGKKVCTFKQQYSPALSCIEIV